MKTGIASYSRISGHYVHVPSVGDLGDDEKVNFLLYDIAGDGNGVNTGYIAGFFDPADFWIPDNEGSQLDMLHIDIGNRHGGAALTNANPDAALAVYSTLAHEFQHLLYHTYFGAHVGEDAYNESSWFNETMSAAAEAYFTIPGSKLVDPSRLIAAAANEYDYIVISNNPDYVPYSDFLHHDGYKTYGMERMLAHYLGDGFMQPVYSHLAETYTTLNTGVTMDQAVGGMIAAGANTSAIGGEAAIKELYFKFMENFASDNPNLLDDNSEPENNLWAVRPALGSTLTVNGGTYSLLSFDPIPTLASGGTIALQGYGTPSLSPTHEMLYKLDGSGDSDNLVLTIGIEDEDPDTKYYVAVLNEYGSVAGDNGAELHPLTADGTDNEIDTEGRDACLFVSTFRREVDVAVNFGWSAATAEPKEISIATAAPLTKTYDGTGDATPGAVTFDGEVGGYPLVLNTDYTVSAVFTSDYNAGSGKPYTYTVTLTESANAKNYTLDDPTIDGINGVINKASTGLTAATPIAIIISSGNTGAQTFDLSTIVLSTDPNQITGAVSYGLGAFTDGGNIILTGVPTISGGTTLNYTGNGKTTGSATQVITISTANYEDIDITITFTATEKDIATDIAITEIESSITYGETLTDPVVASTQATATTETFDLLYEGTKGNGEEYSDTSAPTEPGSYTLTATLKEESTHAGSKTFSFTIEKAYLTWTPGTAENKTYDDETDATVDTAAGLDGVINSDDVTPDVGSVSFADKNAGDGKTVTAAGYGITGTDAWKYNAPAGQPNFGTANIAKLALTVTPDSGHRQDKRHGRQRQRQPYRRDKRYGIQEGNLRRLDGDNRNDSDRAPLRNLLRAL